mgnify:CR=1 FL=1
MRAARGNYRGFVRTMLCLVCGVSINTPGEERVVDEPGNRAQEMLDTVKARSLVGLTRDKEVVDLMLDFAAEAVERSNADLLTRLRAVEADKDVLAEHAEAAFRKLAQAEQRVARLETLLNTAVYALRRAVTLGVPNDEWFTGTADECDAAFTPPPPGPPGRQP